MNTILGKKIAQTQKFLENGTRIPVTEVSVPGNPVVYVKTMDKHGYFAIQLGFGNRKKATKALLGHSKGARLQTAPRFLREVRLADADASTIAEVGSIIKVSQVLKPGDIVDVTGISKGKGYAGVVKRHHFKGGPRTHGQSDRERAPGSIGQTTTPGRVYKGKRMAGRMGQDTVTVKNLQVVDITDDTVLLKGLIPGSINTIVTIVKKGEAKKFVPLYKEKQEKPQQEEEATTQKLETSEEESQPQEKPQEETPPQETSEEKQEKVKEEAENAS